MKVSFTLDNAMVKMEIAKVSIILLLATVLNGVAKEVCPRMCICDVFEGYKRADCR